MPWPLVIIAVPADAARELEHQELARRLPVVRGAVFDSLVSVGTDAAVLVTLLQAPGSVRAFAAWLRSRSARSEDSIELTAKLGDRRAHLTITGDIDISVVTEFLDAAFGDHQP
jgi:hypothetical protein